jgi:hypothetical protein
MRILRKVRYNWVLYLKHIKVIFIKKTTLNMWLFFIKFYGL